METVHRKTTFTNSYCNTCDTSAGSSGTPPFGLQVSPTGVTCSNVAITSVGIAGATITVSGCSGNGSIDVTVRAGVALGENAETTAASSTQSLTIDNTEPAATLAVTSSVVGVAGGDNTATAVFSELVQNLSSTNANGEFTVSGCTTTGSSSAPASGFIVVQNGASCSNIVVASASSTGASISVG